MNQIDVVGLGPGSPEHLTLETKKLLLAGYPVYLRTAVHPLLSTLKEWGCVYTSFDELYQTFPDFETLYEEICAHLLAEAQNHHHIVYAVPGHPLMAETTVHRLKERAIGSQITVKIYPALSCLDTLFNCLDLDPSNGLQILDGVLLKNPHDLNLTQPTLIVQVYSPYIASEVKITLL